MRQHFNIYMGCIMSKDKTGLNDDLQRRDETSVARRRQQRGARWRKHHLGILTFPNLFIFLLALRPNAAMVSLFTRFLDHTQRRTTVGRTRLDEWSARRRDICLTTHNTHNRDIYTPSGIRTHNISRLRPRGNRDRLQWFIKSIN